MTRCSRTTRTAEHARVWSGGPSCGKLAALHGLLISALLLATPTAADAAPEVVAVAGPRPIARVWLRGEGLDMPDLAAAVRARLADKEVLGPGAPAGAPRGLAALCLIRWDAGTVRLEVILGDGRVYERSITAKPAGPAASSSTRYRSGDPSGSSNTPSRRTSPQMVKTIVPGAPSVPLARSQSGPSARMWGTLAKVSTLLTRVGLSAGGLANSPWMNGRATRGRGGRPSITSSSPVSSPNRYRSGPRTISTGTPPSASASRISPSARVRAWTSAVKVSFRPM